MAFSRLITDEAALRQLIPPAPAGRLSHDKQIDLLDDHARAWIVASPLVLLATSSADGSCDVSPRGGPPGWVRVIDERHLALPDAPGNRRLDSLRNVLANPHCGLLFLVPGRRETVRINGDACITDDPQLLGGIPGSPVVALGVTVAEVYMHCSKALIRSDLWNGDSWPDPQTLATGAEILRDHAAINGRRAAIGDVEAQVAESISERLW